MNEKRILGESLGSGMSQMVDLKNFRNVTSLTEIQSLVANVYKEKETLIVWQEYEETKVSYNAKIIKLHLDKNYFIIELLEKFNEKTDPWQSLFVTNTHYTFLFKSTMQVIKEGQFKIILPIQIKRIEMRQYPRQEFAFIQDRRCKIKVSSDEESFRSKIVECRFINIGQKGLAVVTTKSNLYQFKLKQFVKIEELDGVKVSYEGNVSYHKEFSCFTGSGHFEGIRIGIEIPNGILMDKYQ